MTEDLRSEMEKVKSELRRIAGEVERLKGRKLVIAEDEKGELRYEYKDVVALEKLMRDIVGKIDEGGAIIHAGYLVKGGKRIGIWVNTASMDKWMDEPLKIPPQEITKFLSPFSSEQRMIILRSLYEDLLEGKTVSDLVEETGFEGGQLYHHLKELERANYVETREERGRYFISVMGHIALLTVSHMAMALPRYAEQKLGEVESASTD